MVGRIARLAAYPDSFRINAGENPTRAAGYRNIYQGDRMAASRLMTRLGTHLMACRLHGLEILKHAIKR